MITELGIADYAFCPTLWSEPTKRDKRIKPARKGDRDLLQEILDDLIKGKSTKRALISSQGLGYVAEAYTDSFWLELSVGEAQLLVTLKKITLARTRGVYVMTLQRDLYRPPETPEQIHAQEMVRRLLHHAACERLNDRTEVVVVARSGTWKEELKEKVTPLQLIEAREWAEEMRRVEEEDAPMIPRLENCGRCYWRECPKKRPIVTMPKSSRTTFIASE